MLTPVSLWNMNKPQRTHTQRTPPGSSCSILAASASAAAGQSGEQLRTSVTAVLPGSAHALCRDAPPASGRVVMVTTVSGAAWRTRRRALRRVEGGKVGKAVGARTPQRVPEVSSDDTLSWRPAHVNGDRPARSRSDAAESIASSHFRVASRRV